jgi:peroxin-13
MGYLPSPYLETIQRRPQQAQITDKAANSGSSSPLESSRLNTMTGSNPASRANSMVKEEVKVKPVMPSGKPGDVSMESFQRGGFYQ